MNIFSINYFNSFLSSFLEAFKWNLIIIQPELFSFICNVISSLCFLSLIVTYFPVQFPAPSTHCAQVLLGRARYLACSIIEMDAA